MYFPYFRGRQYELLALKELATKKLISSAIVPIIEPVKIIPALNNSLSAFQDASLPVALVINPNVGDLTDEPQIINQLLEKYLSPNVIPAILTNESAEKGLIELKSKGVDTSEILTILNDPDLIETYQAVFQQTPKYTLCPYDRHIRRTVKENSVLFENKFNKRSRNADYPEDELFSNDHIDYREDDYVGFGDYSIIGSDYIESGLAPYAVAIHIVYFAEDGSLRIRHFVSDSNDDISDVAGKFYEAVSKLHKWYTTEKQDRQLTTGLQTLLDHFKNKTYPGLPTLKKLSIMHHLELMDRYLNGRFENELLR